MHKDKKKMQHVADQLREAADEIEKELAEDSEPALAAAAVPTLHARRWPSLHPDPNCIYCRGTGRMDCPAAKYDDEAYLPCPCYYGRPWLPGCENAVE